MATGQVGFKDSKKVKKVHVIQRENAIVNRLNKTKEEKFPNLKEERDDWQKEQQRKELAAKRERQKEELKVSRERKDKAWQKDHAYDDLFSEENIAMSSNAERGTDFEDDFM